jgi:outer membrane protein OmpA-like peptidoglycan-associated protein
MRKLLHALALSALSLLPAAAAVAQDNPKCEPNPLFSRFPGEVMGICERARFKALEMWRAASPDKPDRNHSTYQVEGEFWYYMNDIGKDASGLQPGKLEVRRNFENAVLEAKGTVLAVDESKVYYVVKRPDGEYHGQAGCGRGGSGGACSATIHKMVRVAGMQQSVVVSADQIAKGIADEGKAVFYGLYFDSGKSVLKPESAPTLVEMAKWLNTNPANNVYIVGHTDMQGGVESNMVLSRARAAAVVDALIKQHAVKRERLGSDGVGPYAPLSNNTSEAGRAKNRRVEMVLR